MKKKECPEFWTDRRDVGVYVRAACVCASLTVCRVSGSLGDLDGAGACLDEMGWEPNFSQVYDPEKPPFCGRLARLDPLVPSSLRTRRRFVTVGCALGRTPCIDDSFRRRDRVASQLSVRLVWDSSWSLVV